VASEPRSNGWKSYDSVVGAYEKAAAPRFAVVARDLVAAAAPREGARVLDVGTGTGIAGEIAREYVGRGGFVAGVDPSIPMLERAAARGLVIVAGTFPGLPFPRDAFDAVLANLVLSHLDDYEQGVADAVRVLHGGGRFGGTAWGPAIEASEEHQAPDADAIVESVIVSHGLDLTPPTPPVPSEEPLRARDTLERVLRGAGLADVDVQSRTYQWTYSVDEYLVGRDWRPGVRYIRQQAGSELWREITSGAASRLRDRFGGEIRTMGQMWIAAGTKP
jgi:SAM-dependent methyltransferase